MNLEYHLTLCEPRPKEDLPLSIFRIIVEHVPKKLLRLIERKFENIYISKIKNISTSSVTIISLWAIIFTFSESALCFLVFVELWVIRVETAVLSVSTASTAESQKPNSSRG